MATANGGPVGGLNALTASEAVSSLRLPVVLQLEVSVWHARRTRAVGMQAIKPITSMHPEKLAPAVLQVLSYFWDLASLDQVSRAAGKASVFAAAACPASLCPGLEAPLH